MDDQDGVGLGFVRVGDAIDKKEETDDVRLPIDDLMVLLSLEEILYCLGILSAVHGVYLRPVLPVLLDSLDVSVNLLSKEELGHVLVYVSSCGRDRDCKVLLTLDGDPDVLGIGPLAPVITRQGLGGCGELFRLGSCIHVINMTLQVLG